MGITMREECRVMVFENRVLRKIFGPKRDEVTKSWGDYITRNCMICTPHQILFRWSNEEDLGGLGMWHIWVTRGVYRILVRPGHRWEDSIKMNFQDWDGEAWTGLIWLRIGTGGGRLWMRSWTFGFHKMQGISWLAEDLSASQEGLCFMELVCLFLISVLVYVDPFLQPHNSSSWNKKLFIIEQCL
jgi:hypothetical protein